MPMERKLWRVDGATLAKLEDVAERRTGGNVNAAVREALALLLAWDRSYLPDAPLPSAHADGFVTLQERRAMEDVTPVETVSGVWLLEPVAGVPDFQQVTTVRGGRLWYLHPQPGALLGSS